VQAREVVVQPVVVLERRLERVGALVVVAEVHDAKALARRSTRRQLALEHGRHRLIPRDAVAVRRAAAEYDNAIFARRLATDGWPAVAPDIEPGRAFEPAVQVDVDDEQRDQRRGRGKRDRRQREREPSWSGHQAAIRNSRPAAQAVIATANGTR